MHKFKRKLLLLVVFCIVVQAILPAHTAKADEGYAAPVLSNDEWCPKFTEVDTTIKKNSVNLSTLSIPITLRKNCSGSSRDSYIYGVARNMDYFNNDITFSLNYDNTQRDFFICSKNKDYEISIPKATILKDLYNLYKVYGTGDKDFVAGDLDYMDITIGSDMTLGDALTKLDKHWFKLAFFTEVGKNNANLVTKTTASDIDMYFAKYSRDDVSSQDSDIVAVKNFFLAMKKNPNEYLDVLTWWYNIYYKKKHNGKEINIKVKAKDKSYEPEDELGRFVVHCVTGEMLDPKDAEAERQEEYDDLLNKQGAPTDTSKFEDWCRAMALIHEGKKPNGNYSEDFLDLSKLMATKLNSYQKAQILSILNLPNSKQKSDVKLKNYDTSVASIQKLFDSYNYANQKDIDAYKELTQNSLDNIKNLGEEDYSDWTTRMLTYEDRVNYLICTSYSGESVDEFVESYYTNPISTLMLNPEVSYINIGQGSLISGKYKVKNAQAYIYLVSTITELYSISREVPVTIQAYITNNTISSQRKYIQGMQSMYNALRLINSEQAWKLWSTPYDDKTPSLQELYDQMTSIGVFEGLDISTEFSSDRPLGTFMDIDTEVLSPMYLKGIAYSSTYLPMNTNVYDAYTLASYEEDFLKNFHYKYGFHRKALYIDTNSSSAVDLHNTGRKGETRVCTLKDLLNPEKDIVLYIDDNFYNVNKLAELMDKSFNRLDNVDEETDTRPWYEKIWSKVSDYFTIDIYEQTKTAEEIKYSDKLRKKVMSTSNSTYKADASPNSYEENGSVKKPYTDNVDQYVLTSSQINDYLDCVTTSKEKNTDTGEDITTTVYDPYSVLMSYAVVSSVYRDGPLYKKANADMNTEPVFISSPNLACLTNTSNYEKASILNYILLKNLKANIPVGYNYNLDMNSAVYMDIYGNILTESGVVVVPAACNMSLYVDDYYKDLYNVGLFSVYGDEYSLPSDYEGVSEIMSGAFEIDEDFSIWKIKSRVVDAGVADYARIATGDKATSQAIQKQFEYNLEENVHLYDFKRFFPICMEVLRGAPIENIDKDFEGLNTNRRVSKAGLVAAAKLEELQKSLQSGDANSILTLPNLAFMDGLEYVVVFLFKVLVFIVILVMMVTVYIDVVGAQLNLKTFAKCFWIVILTICTVVTIPTIFQLTYYQSNRALLQEETAYIAMLNLEKEQSGVEIGVYDVSVPDISTKLLLKLEDINVPWYDVFSKVMLSSTFNNLEEVYSSYAESVPSSQQEDVVIMNDGVYMYVDDLFSSADVNISLANNQLYMRTNETLTTSFYSPYYAILETLIKRVNDYNIENNWYAYTTKMHKGGKLKTVGLISQYFNSTDFMESEGDILSICELHGIPQSLDIGSPFSDSDIEVMQKSLWTNTVLPDEQVYKRADIISDYLREFVAENKNIMGKISDETFLKVMALSVAMKHNQVFGVTSADCYEIYNLSNDDLMRLSISNRDLVMSNSTLTFSRFVYEVGGTPAVYAAAILSMITWVSSYVKPICTILVFLAIFVSLFIFKICLRKKSSNLYGYAITTILLCACNLLHSLLLKFSMYLPILHLAPTVCIILQALLQLGYMAILCKVTYVAFREWQDLGFDRYQAKAQKIVATSTPKLFRGIGDNRYNDSYMDRRVRPKNKWDYYNKLVDTHKERNKR